MGISASKKLSKGSAIMSKSAKLASVLHWLQAGSMTSPQKYTGIYEGISVAQMLQVPELNGVEHVE